MSKEFIESSGLLLDAGNDAKIWLNKLFVEIEKECIAPEELLANEATLYLLGEKIKEKLESGDRFWRATIKKDNSMEDGRVLVRSKKKEKVKGKK